MSNDEKIKQTHLQRSAFVYVRQSTASQVEHNRESTQRQYKLVDRAVGLGWSKPQVKTIDEDSAQSGSTSIDRSGFTVMTTEVALGHVGLILSIEVSRVARNNADWYRLLDLCGVTDTLIGDEDGLYHPGLFNDRLLLGLKGTMAEAELHVIRARLEGGIRNKAVRGELRRGLPIGFVWGDADGEVLFHPDQAVRGAIRTVFEKFTELGSVRQVWLWFLSQDIKFPSQSTKVPELRWINPTYPAIHQVLSNPVYAGAYTYGKTRREPYVDESGRLRKRVKHLPPSQWEVLIQDHHEGFIDWETYDMNRARIANNTRPRPHQAGGAVREGSALLQGIATCGHCGRRLTVYYSGKNSTPGYYCATNCIVSGRGKHCLSVGGVQINKAVADAFLQAVTPAAVEVALVAEKDIEADREAALRQWRLQVEKAQYEADRAERRYRAVDPGNRLVAHTLEGEWENRLDELASAKNELVRREAQRPKSLTDEQCKKIRSLGADLKCVWEAETTTDRDRKELLRILLEEVSIASDRGASNAHLTLRWRGGAISELDVNLRRYAPTVRTDEDTIELIRRLAAHHPDAVIAGILNRQGRRAARGGRFTVSIVGSLRRRWNIPRFDSAKVPTKGELVPAQKAAEILGVAASTVHRWLLAGIIGGEQITPGAPWRIRMSPELRERFVEEAPEGYVPMLDAMRILGISRQTVLQRVKRGELSSLHVRRGRRNGLYIKALDNQIGLFDNLSSKGV
jgi:DNA invertase Pin-like site-specific DNA recombinase